MEEQAGFRVEDIAQIVLLPPGDGHTRTITLTEGTVVVLVPAEVVEPPTGKKCSVDVVVDAVMAMGACDTRAIFEHIQESWPGVHTTYRSVCAHVAWGVMRGVLRSIKDENGVNRYVTQ